MISWNKFDKIMLDFEHQARKGVLPLDTTRMLKRNRCWRGEEPYCTYKQFTYEMSNDQIKEIVNTYYKAKK